MLKKDLILRNPLRLLGDATEEVLSDGGFGAILARAGVGKTALLVQLALNTLLNDKNVLHISLDDPVSKVIAWYQEVFQGLAVDYNAEQINQLWESVLHQRFIMSFKVEGFSVPKLEERLADLSEQNIFSPHMIIIDGFPFDEQSDERLAELKEFARIHQKHIWFTVTTHRHESPDLEGIPVQLEGIQDLFEVILQLKSEKEKVHVNVMKGVGKEDSWPELLLESSTMLLAER